MNNLIVSVLMPVYNAERYLREAVESILTQTFTDFEFLIVDDGSTDGSLSILEEYAAKDDRIKLTSRPNTGLVAALNEMLAIAQGEFIARMDADDIALPERFALQLEQMQNNKNLVAIGNQVLLVDPNNRALCVANCPLTHRDIDDQHLRGIGLAISHPSVMLRASAVREVSGYDPQFWPAEDVDLFLRLAEIGDVANLPVVGLRYRLHRASIGNVHRPAQIAAAHQAAAAAYRRRGKPESTLPAPRTDRDIEDYRVTWAWWALRGRQVATARKYALAAFLRDPLSIERMRLLYCALRGR